MSLALLGVGFGVGCGEVLCFPLPFKQSIIQTHGAKWVHETHADVAGDGLGPLGVRADGFSDPKLLHGADGQDAPGASEIESAGVVETVDEVEPDDAGEKKALFVRGEGLLDVAMARFPRHGGKIRGGRMGCNEGDPRLVGRLGDLGFWI
jgi:hypothetical protein